MLTGAEVSSHNTKKSCWLVIDNQVYDFTTFLDEHPGGAAVLLKQAGTDATAAFKQYHPSDYLDDLPKESHLGPLDPETSDQLASTKSKVKTPQSAEGKVPHVSLCVRTSDFEAAAKSVLSPKAWVYATGSANSGQALATNLDAWSQLSLRLRALRKVESVDTSTTILGQKTTLPFFVAAMGTLGIPHESGEFGIVKGVIPSGLHAVISTASTKPTEKIMECFLEEQQKVNNSSPSRLFFQLYIPSDRNRGIELIRRVKKAGYKGLWITVDAPVLGKRTADRYLQAQEALEMGAVDVHVGEENSFAPNFGGRPAPGQLSANLGWDDLKWVRKEWDGPIVLKGIQCAEDAKLAAEHGCQGILLSNHGGRQSHAAPSSLMTLLEIRTYCPEVLDQLEVFVDGGLRDGADILKALCLGATAVGVGRPFLFALTAYGSIGVQRCIQILAEELEIGMRLLGITSLDQARPDLVNASRLLNDMWRPEKFPSRL